MATRESLASIDVGSWVQVADLAIALLLAVVIGIERELRAKSAGLRTHALVGVGSAAFVIISKYGFGDVLAQDHVALDPSRIAANIVTGIGFIGGGLIFIKGDAVRGLTTAASIWLVSAVGAAAGAGLWVLATTLTVAHLGVVVGLAWLGRHLPRSATAGSRLDITYRVGHGSFGTAIETLTSAGFTIAAVTVRTLEDGGRRARIQLGGTGSLMDAAGSIEELPGVRSVRALDANVEIE